MTIFGFIILNFKSGTFHHFNRLKHLRQEKKNKSFNTAQKWCLYKMRVTQNGTCIITKWQLHTYKWHLRIYKMAPVYLQNGSYVITRCSQLAWSHEEGILNGLQYRSISTPATSYSGDSSRAPYTKRNLGQRWTWNRTSGTKWQQFLLPCCNEWCRTSRNTCRNVLKRDTTSKTLYSGSEYFN